MKGKLFKNCGCKRDIFNEVLPMQRIGGKHGKKIRTFIFSMENWKL